MKIRRRQLLSAAAAFGGAALVPGCARWQAGETAAELSAAQAAQRIRDGELRAETHVAELLRRHERHGGLNAIISIDPARALQAAREVDRQRARGEPLGPLAGVPLMVKDNIDAAGYATTAGTPALKGYEPQRNAAVVEALQRAGAIVFAKANLHELAAGGTSSNAAFGFVRNPHDRTRIPGGSSGGTAAAIAARMVPAGLGTDTAGSVRLPAALCGIAGLRPSLPEQGALWPQDGVVPLSYDLDTAGPMARTVADLALMHQVVTGQATSPLGSLSGVRIGVPREPFWGDLEADVSRVCEAALLRLRDAGAVLVPVDLAEIAAAAAQMFRTLTAIGYTRDLDDFLLRHRVGVTLDAVIAGMASRDAKSLFETLRRASVRAAAAEQVRRQARPALVARYRAALQGADVAAIVFPTVPIAAPAIREQGNAPGDTIVLNGKPVPEVFTLIRNTLPTGVLRAPGLSLPAGLTQQGLPVGIELDGLPGDDTRLLALGMAVEGALGRIAAPVAS